MERCCVCVLPTSYPAVTFGEDGVCSLCRDRVAAGKREIEARQARWRQLEGLVGQARERKGPYDCVVPVSGGRDSSYVAWFIGRHLGLRVLGVNYDNGYRSPEAVRNLERISDRLGIGIVTLKPEPGLFRRTFAHFLRITGYFCAACDALGYIVVGSFLAREAVRLGHHPLVVGGWSKKYEYQPGLSVLSMSYFGDILRRDADLHRDIREDPLVEPRVFDAFVEVGDIRQARTGQRRAGGVPGLVQLPDCVDWEYEEMATTLEDETGWERPDHGSAAHFDCLLSPIPRYLKLRKFGLCQETIRNSVLVREGRLAREDALAEVEAIDATEPPIFREALAQWGMTADEVAWDAEWSR